MNERIKELRKVLNLSQESFSSKLNISEPCFTMLSKNSVTASRFFSSNFK